MAFLLSYVYAADLKVKTPISHNKPVQDATKSSEVTDKITSSDEATGTISILHKASQLQKINNFTQLGSFKDWEAFSMITAQETVCWISSAPINAYKVKRKVNEIDAVQSALMLSIRLEKKERDELAYHSHHSLESDEKLMLKIDRMVQFALIPQDQWAWLQSSIDESRFVLASQKGYKLRISGKTIHDKKFTETYSLLGFTDAYKTAFEACNEALNKKALASY
ncbi:MAG: hypothetical protein ACJARD_000848 [Alphaproteobacteria bacterium]